MEDERDESEFRKIPMKVKVENNKIYRLSKET